MRYSVLAAIPVFLSAAAAQSIPTCAQACLATAIAASGCGTTDYSCQCTTGLAAITKSATVCLVQSTCTAAELEQVEALASSQCAAYASSSSSSSVTPSTSSSATATPAAITTAPSYVMKNGTATATGAASASGTGSYTVAPYTGGAAAKGVEVGVLGVVALAALVL